MRPAYLLPFANHLWQSTLFAGVAGLLTLALRNNHTRVRHWVWLAASCKFVIPLSVLIALGSDVAWRTAPEATQSNVFVVMNAVSQPFTARPVSSRLFAPAPPAANPLPLILCGVWACGSFGITGSWWVRWRRIRATVRAGSPLPIVIPFLARSSPTLLEPGVFGLFRPVLLLPDGIFERLTPAQLQAVIAHELCHVRHRDNLAAAIHMFVETAFWFYPLVWWIGKRMVEERERACDEEVLQFGSEPRVYAEGILNVCKLYAESPLVCMSGVAGSNLTKRVQAILANRIVHRLSFAKKIALAGAGTAALVLPFVIGIMNAPLISAQSPSPAAQPISYVASIKPNNAVGARTFSEYFPGGRLTATAVTVGHLLRIAYRIQPYQLVGAPAWISNRRYDIAAKVDDNPPPSQQALLQVLLKGRFKLAVHNETRELPMFALVLARSDGKLGPQLTKSTFDCAAYLAGHHAPPELGRTPNCATRINVGFLSGRAIPMTQLATSLAPFVNRFTVDRTGLTGGFDVELRWTPEQISSNIAGHAVPDASSNAPGPSIFSALQEQLGLKLTAARGPVEVLVIDHVERPSGN